VTVEPVDPIPVDPPVVDVGAVLAEMVSTDSTTLDVLAGIVLLLAADLRAAGQLEGLRWESLTGEVAESVTLEAPPTVPPSRVVTVPSSPPQPARPDFNQASR
jgi:hypothetical protein